MSEITDEDILLEELNKHDYSVKYELGSAEYWKNEGWDEAIDEAIVTVRKYLKKKGLLK